MHVRKLLRALCGCVWGCVLENFNTLRPRGVLLHTHAYAMVYIHTYIHVHISFSSMPIERQRQIKSALWISLSTLFFSRFDHPKIIRGKHKTVTLSFIYTHMHTHTHSKCETCRNLLALQLGNKWYRSSCRERTTSPYKEGRPHGILWGAAADVATGLAIPFPHPLRQLPAMKSFAVLDKFASGLGDPH